MPDQSNYMKKVNNESDLIDRILAGNRQAFKELVVTYQRLVNHIVYRIMPDSDEREDICQEVFIKVYRNLGRYRAEARLSTWIGTIAANCCYDFLRKKNIAIDDDRPDDYAGELPDNTAATDRLAEQQDLAALLRNEIDRLPRHYRTIITLYHLDELSYDEIGRVLNLPDGTVKSYLFRGRKILRERLQARYNKEELWP